VGRREGVLAGIVVLGLGGALVYGGVRHPDVLTGVAHAAVGVAVLALGWAGYRGSAVQAAAVMSAIAVTLTVAGFAVGGALGITAGVLGVAALFAGAVAYASENYGLFAYALLGDGLATAALGAHHLRADATLLGVAMLVATVACLGTAAVLGRAAS
jgi:hypothetical protein